MGGNKIKVGNSMKVSEMNERQKKAFKNVKYAAYDLLGGLENTMLDYPESSEEYKRAKALLNNHAALVRVLYYRATTAVYTNGAVWFNKAAQMFIREINFCGKEWLMECCERRITKGGY